jgi:hypothetical protein
MVYDLGKIIPRIKGNYSSSTTYDVLDVVYYNGSSYICKQSGTRAKTPTNTTYWQIFALKGEMTTQLTPAQINEIVQGVMNQGVVVDNDYAAFKASTEAAIQTMPQPGAGILTIKRNNVTVDSFSANASTDKSINISVPTSMSQMADYNDFIKTVWTGKVEKLEATTRELDKLTPGTAYVWLDPIPALRVNNLVPYVDVAGAAPAKLLFSTSTAFRPDLPDASIHDCTNNAEFTRADYTFSNNGIYMLEVYGDVVFVYDFKKVTLRGA